MGNASGLSPWGDVPFPKSYWFDITPVVKAESPLYLCLNDKNDKRGEGCPGSFDRFEELSVIDIWVHFFRAMGKRAIRYHRKIFVGTLAHELTHYFDSCYDAESWEGDPTHYRTGAWEPWDESDQGMREYYNDTAEVNAYWTDFVIEIQHLLKSRKSYVDRIVGNWDAFYNFIKKQSDTYSEILHTYLSNENRARVLKRAHRLFEKISANRQIS